MNTLVKNNIKSKGVLYNLLDSYNKLCYNPDLFQENTIIIQTPIEFIVCLVENKKPLSLFEVHNILTSSSNVSNFTGINNYILIATGGYEEECSYLDGYSVRLEDSTYLESILNNSNNNTPIELLPHNNFTYKNILKMWETQNLVSVVQATGTGKSYLVAKILQSKNYKSAIICPTNEILKQFEELFNEYSIDISNIDFMTYSKLALLSTDEVKEKNYDFILIDEFHRAGASKWGIGIQKLLSNNEKAKVLGTSATPIRYLDDRRNMVDELFEGNVANNIDLFEAIGRGILPSPKYIEAIYDISDDIKKLSHTVKDNTIITTEDKEKILEDIQKFKVSWDNVKTVSSIIQKHFDSSIKKAVVFCKDTAHLKDMIPLVTQWFSESNVYKKVNTFMSYSTTGDKIDQLSDFKHTTPDGEIDILFSINKLSEGIHVDNVSAVIFLRNTTSNNIFLQQLGRVFSASNTETTPIVLDLINNLEIVENSHIYSYIQKSAAKFNSIKKQLGLLSDKNSVMDVKFEVIDETKDLIEFIANTQCSLKYGWNDYLEKAIECKKETGWFPSTKTPNVNKDLILWVKNQRSLYKRDLLSSEKIKTLKQVGFYFSFNEEKWFNYYNELIKYKNDNNLETFFRHSITDVSLNKWVANQRRKYKDNELNEEEIKLLSDIGISFDALQDIWSYYIEKLKKFYEINGYKTPAEKEDFELAVFCRNQRRLKREDKLPQEKINDLNSINFIWEKEDTTVKFNERIAQLKEYISIYGDTKVPSRFKDFNYLGEWVKHTRVKRRKGLLSEERIQALDNLNFCWDPKDESLNKLLNSVIDYTIKKQSNIPVSSPKRLVDYMTSLRFKYKNNELDSETIEKLNAVNFCWDPTSSVWEKRINQLKEYYAKYNTFKLSKKTGFPDITSLTTWINRQKDLYHKGNYSEEKAKQLMDIGFDFNKVYEKPKL